MPKKQESRQPNTAEQTSPASSLSAASYNQALVASLPGQMTTARSGDYAAPPAPRQSLWSSVFGNSEDRKHQETLRDMSHAAEEAIHGLTNMSVISDAQVAIGLDTESEYQVILGQYAGSAFAMAAAPDIIQDARATYREGARSIGSASIGRVSRRIR